MNYQEYKQSLNQRLTDKVQRELSAFREEILGKPPQEIAALLGVPVEAVTAVTDQAQPQNHGGSEQQLETGEF